LRVHGRGNCSLVEVILTAVLVALLLRVDKVDLDEKDGGIYQAKERNECLSFVKLRIFDEIGIPCDHCINLQLRHAEERSKEVRPESRLADTLSRLVNVVLSYLKHVLDQTASSLDESCEINERDDSI